MASPKRTNGRSLRATSRTIPAGKAVTRRPMAKAAPKPPAGANDQSALPKIHQQFLDTVGTAIETSRSPEEVMAVCLRFLLDSTKAQGSSIHLFDEQTKELRCVLAQGTLDSMPPAELSTGIAAALKDQRPVEIADLRVYPVKRTRALDGVLVVQGLSGGKDSVGRVGLVDFIVMRLPAALDHSRLAQKYQQKIARIQQLEEVSEILNSTLDEDEIVRRAVETAAKLVGAEAGSLLLLHEMTGELTFLVAVGDKGVQLKEVRLKLGQGIAGLVAQTNQPIIVNDAPNDPRVAHQVDEKTGFTTRSILAVPVRARNKTLGVLEAVNKRGERPFSNWDLLEFSSLANQVAIALENSRLFRKTSEKIKRLEKFKEISALFNSTLNQAEIRKRAIEAATVLMEAEAGSLLLLDEPAGELYFEVALGEKGEGVRQIRLKVGQGIAGHVAKTGQPEIINDCYADARFNREADKKSGFRTRNMVCVPVKARDRLLGVLQAINKKDEGSFAEDDLQDFISLGHQVGIAIENANLYEEINRLFEGFISASVLAIESRDPTTSGHSGRVATLTCSLAEVVDRVDTGPYKDFTFDYDQMNEIRYAAVLHDFGKVGVREHVLIKADKLFPEDLARLKARFDFIKRTLEVKSLRKKVEILQSGDRTATAQVLAELDEELARQIAETDGILEFILNCNKPTVLKTGGFERLHEIAQQNFEHFDGAKPLLTQQEVLTLSIPKGSLTTEERLEIESHVTHTYRFLSTIPWTKSLKNIPLIAYGHHEKLDGTGYPRQVPGDTISVQTRMMTISDIFDALTASDRPYKAAVPMPKALAILEDEMRHGKVDAQLLQLFIDSKVYEKVKS
jgi:HD-GYP domain-containing protein (c-di-GMP phosphodiesterase class II)